jgi:hypothetical protein
VAAWRSPSLLAMPSWGTMGAGIHGIPARTVRMEKRRAPPRMRRGAGTVAVDLGQPRLTVHRLGGDIPRASEGEHRGPLKAPHRFQRCAALELSQDAVAARTQ